MNPDSRPWRHAMLWLCPLMAACATSAIGPATIPPARLDYNQAISRSWDEQLLLNLVRLRYLESPLFLDINSVTATYSAGRTGSIGLKKVEGAAGEFTAGMGMDFRDSPVINYVPLQGDAFARRLLAPISLDSLAALLRAGWDAELLMQCCVQAFGPLHNDAAEGDAFRKAAGALGAMQRARHLRVIGTSEGLALDFGPPSAAYAELQALFKQVAMPRRLALIDAEGNSERAIGVQTRSLLAVMYVLSLGVEVPPEDAQRVAQLQGPDGSAIDLSAYPHRLRVRQSAAVPAEALASAAVRGRNYWIDDRDLSSKQMLALLRMLLSLTAAERPAGTPLLSIQAH